jgi:hypothetical protein
MRTHLRIGVSLLVLLVGGVALKAQTPAPAAYLTIAAELQPIDPAWVQSVESRLARFERDTQIKVLMRGHASSPTDAEDSQPGAYMRGLAAKLGTAQAGVLAVYFADVQEWRIWFGDDLTPRFVGRPGTAKEFTESGAMHDAKEAWLADVFDKATKAFESRSATEARALAQFQAEALIDGLVARLGTATK